MANGATRRVIRTPPMATISTKTVATRIGKIAVGESATASPTPERMTSPSAAWTFQNAAAAKATDRHDTAIAQPRPVRESGR